MSKWQLSDASRAKIAAAQKERWSKTSDRDRLRERAAKLAAEYRDKHQRIRVLVKERDRAEDRLRRVVRRIAACA